MRPEFTIYALYGTPTHLATGETEQRILQARFPRKAAPEWKSDRMAHLDIVGPLEFADYIDIRAKADSIRKNDRVEQVLLYMNCPGGVAAGAPETAAALSALNKEKPILCVAEGYCTSAGYELAAQCSELVVSPTCLVGSVGTRSVLVDDSEMFKRLGLRVIPISTGADKNVGLEGVPVDDAAVQVMTDMVNALQRQFILALKNSPFLTSKEIVAMAENASVWLGDSAVKLGYATRLGTYEQIIDELQTADARNQNGESTRRNNSFKQKIESLRGEKAIDKFAELVGYPSTKADHERIAMEYPKLFAAAMKFDPDYFEE